MRFLPRKFANWFRLDFLRLEGEMVWRERYLRRAEYRKQRR